MEMNIPDNLLKKFEELLKISGSKNEEFINTTLENLLKIIKTEQNSNLEANASFDNPYFPFTSEKDYSNDPFFESEKIYKKLLLSMPDIVIRTDISGTITFVNKESLKFWEGIPREEFIGKNMMSFIAEEDKERAIENTKLMFGAQLGLNEYKIVFDNGIIFDCEINGDIIRDTAGNPIGMVYVIRNIMKRKKAEEAHLQSEQRFKALAEAAYEGIVFTENDIIIDANDQYASMFGFKIDELIGKHVIDLLAPESKEPVINAIHSDNEIQYEHFALKKDGTIFPVEARGRVISIGNTRFYVTAILDISERIQAQEAIRKSEEKFRSMIQNLSDILHILDENGIIQYESPSSKKILGYEKDFFIGKNPFGYIHIEDVNRVLKDFKDSVLRDTDNIPTEYRFRHADGSYIFLESIAKNLLDDPDIRGILITSRDITGRKKAEEALRESERQFRAFLNSTEDMAFLKNSQGTYLFVNYAMSEALKLNEDEIIGKTDFDILRKQTAQINFEQDIEALKSDEVIIFEANEGSIIWEIRKFKIQIKDNQYGIGGIIRDITKKKKLERQIIQSEKMSVVGELAGGIAHDLNNILTVLIGNTELLERRLDAASKAQASRYLEALSRANLRAKDIVLQILAFSKRQEINKSEAELNTIVLEIEKMLARLIPENISIIKILWDDELFINADISQVEQIIMNIVINARDSIKGNGSIQLSTRKENILFDIITRNGIMKPGLYALLIIKDNGSGIPNSIIDKIFDPFFTTKEIGKGTGLGLSIVINNISKNDAFLNLYSEIDKGTEFKIYFPLLKNREIPIDKSNISELHLGQGENILIVEDDENIRYLLVEYLGDLNYTIVTANNGLQALKIFENENVDAVLTDITMPEMGGKELFNHLRKMNSSIPIIAMSGYYQHSEVKNLGFYDILDKPLDMSKVSDLFYNIFNKTVIP